MSSYGCPWIGQTGAAAGNGRAILLTLYVLALRFTFYASRINVQRLNPTSAVMQRRECRAARAARASAGAPRAGGGVPRVQRRPAHLQPAARPAPPPAGRAAPAARACSRAAP